MQNVQTSDVQKQDNKVNKNCRLSSNTSSNTSPPSSAAANNNNINNNGSSCKTMSTSSTSSMIPSGATTTTIGPGQIPGQKTNNNNNNNLNTNNKFSTTSNNSTPTKSDTETFSEFQPRVSDSSDNSDEEESVSEVDSFPLDQASIEIPETECSDSCDNDVDDDASVSCDDDDDENEDSEDDEDDDDDLHSQVVSGKFLLENDDMHHESSSHDTKARLEALLEAADEAAQALTRMRSSDGGSPRDKNLLSRSLIAACTDNDVNTVRKLLGEGNSLNEATDDGESLLSLACSAGYYELAQVLLAMSAQVEDRGQKNDCTPLMEAASAGHIDIIELLLKHGADVNAQSSTGNTPLMYACAGGHEGAVKVLLAHGANVEDHNENGHTPLMEAASAGHVGVAKILLEHGAGINTHSNEFKESALTLACYKGHLDMVRFLLEAGADQEHKTDEMHTALMEASMDGHVEVARLLLDSGAQVNMPTDSFESPLTLAACGGHVDLAMLLIERGANIEEVNDEGYTPLMEAAREGHEEMVTLLLSQGANINAQTEETQETALTLACCGGFVEVADYLIKNGADIELGASTPLMEAAQEGHIDLVKFLLENGADVHAQTQTGDTALTYACENGHTEVADILLYYGAELEHESEGGRTPLMKACRAGHWCIVKFLIEKGADVNRHTTNNDHTPLSLACAGGHQNIVELLLKSGADPFHKLKDNSTMLIEAAKGGHIGVVQLLLDYPHSLIAANAAQQQNILNNGQIQQQQQLIITQNQQQTQQQQQQQILTAPPGLHEVPEATRVSNKQLLQTKENLEQHQQQQQIIANNQQHQSMIANQNMFSVGMAAQTDASILSQMRIMQMQGFKDGLAHGLARGQQPQQQQQQQQQVVTGPIMQSNQMQAQQLQQNQQVTNKQRSLLRKTKQPAPSTYETNMATSNLLTTSEAQQVRSEPIGEDSAGLEHRNDYEQYQKMREIYQKSQKANIQFICDSSGPPPTLLPQTASYIDITTPAQGLVCGSGGMSFTAPNGTPLISPMLQTTTTGLATNLSGVKLDNSSLVLGTSLPATLQSQQITSATLTTTIASSQNQSSSTVPSASSTPSTHITAPSEVSQSTAISDRPKVKPVSKKDSKNLRKMAAANTSTLLQPNQMVQLPVIPTSEQNVQMLQSLANLSLSPTVTTTTTTSGGGILPQNQQQPPTIQQQLTISMSQNQQVQPPLSLVTTDANSSQLVTNAFAPNNFNKKPFNLVPTSNLSVITSTGIIQSQISRPHLAQSTQTGSAVQQDPAGLSSATLTTTSTSSDDHENQLNQLAINTICNPKMLHKIAQHFRVEPPKSPPETPPLSSDAPASPPPGKNVGNISLLDSELADLSRIFCEVMHDFRPDLLPTPEFVQVHQHVSNIIQHKAGNNTKITDVDSHQFIEETDEHLAMFNVDDTESATAECGIYPTIDESIETFNPDDVSVVAADGSRETIYNYEWVECIDEVIHALNGCTDIPVALQEMAANLSCQDIDAYANLIGMNSFCKNRWTGQQNQITSGTSSPVEIEDDGMQGWSDDQCGYRQYQSGQIMAIDPQFQQQLSIDQLQILSQLQSQQSLPLIPSTIDPQSMMPSVHAQLQGGIQSPHPSVLSSSVLHHQQMPDNRYEIGRNCRTISSKLDETQQQQQQYIQQSQTSNDGSQQQPKFVFNVDGNEKSSQSLQLLFQLPNVQQDQQDSAQNAAGILTAQAPQAQCKLPQVHNNLQLSQVQGQQICNQHAQVQVATQTQQPPNILAQTLPQTMDMSTTTAPTMKPFTSAVKKSDKVRKDKARAAGVRQAPAGQANFQYDATGTPIQYQNVPNNVLPDRTIDVDSETDSNHDTALTLACAGGHEELVELLISRGANIEHKDKKGFTPLILAATAGHEKVVETLLKNGAEMEAQSERTKDTPLSLACSGGRYEVVELLLNIGANKEHRNVSDYTPLSLAASGGYVNIIKLLLSHGAEINSRTGSKLGISPLMLAAMNGHTAAVKLLLDMGSDINAQIETNRNTALTLACFQGRHEVVSLLLDRKANVEHRAKTGLTPLMEAASGGYIEVGRVLLDKGADVNAAPVPSSRDTALTIAADKGHLKFVELLLQRGAAVEVKNKKGNSPLWLAANGGHLGVVELLCNAGADIDSQDNRKVSCLMAAFRKGHTKAVKWMVNHVTQFPSDQEMTRYISTISDKDLTEKCKDCVRVIRAAKETQAAKANINASILLKELDLERSREESRKAAAAKRRERKKRRKQEKREQQRKLVEGDMPSSSTRDDYDDDGDGDDDDKDDDNDSDKEDDEPIVQQNQSRVAHNPHQEKEEGDSGIDANSQGSCSSSDVKRQNAMENNKKNNKKNTKKQQQLKEQRMLKSPEGPPPAVQDKNQKERPNRSDENSRNKREIVKIVREKIFEKENVAPKEEPPAMKPSKVETVVSKPQPSTYSSQSHTTVPQNSGGNRKSMIVFGRHAPVAQDRGDGGEHDNNDNPSQFYNNLKKIHKVYYNNNDETKSSTSPTKPISNAPKREEGWKEVVRKSSVQQSQTTTIECKKVQVPVHAISRVIGRAGSNINAIRAATGAHIEVEKQGKIQSDRTITIKGSAEALKQAHTLITKLIMDPDVDILQIIPKHITKSTPPTTATIIPAALPTVNPWEKNMAAIVTTLAAATSVLSSIIGAKSKSIFVPSNSKLPASTNTTSATSKIIMSASTRPAVSKNLFINQSSVASSSRPPTYISKLNEMPKRILSSTSGPSNTKTTNTYTNTVQILKNTMKSSAPTTTTSTSSISGTFASKLSSDKKTPPSSASKSQTQKLILQSPVKSAIGSGKHILQSEQHILQGGSHFPAPFGSNVNTVQHQSQQQHHQQQQQQPTVSSSKPIVETSSITQATSASSASNVRSITPNDAVWVDGDNISDNFQSKNARVQPSSSLITSRTISPSPLLQTITTTASSHHETNLVSSLVIQPPSTGLASQLQTKINNNLHGNAQAHEYSLFNDSYSNQMYSSVSPGTFIENEPPLAVDASKAPGYRGSTSISSPVSSKTSSNATTPPSTTIPIQPPTVNQQSASQTPNQGQSNSANSNLTQQQPSQQSYPSPNDQNVIKPPASQSSSNIHQSSGSAVQRSILRQMDYSREAPHQGPGSNSRYQNVRMYEPPLMNYNSDSIPKPFSQMMGLTPGGSNAPTSRLNPKANVFSTMPPSQNKMNQSANQFDNMFHQNPPPQMNNFQKMPQNNGQMPPYNPAPGRPSAQSHHNQPPLPPPPHIPHWFDYPNSTRDMMNSDNTLTMFAGSPSISPNNSQTATNGVLQPMLDDRPKMPRAIGTERAWKYNHSAGFPLETDAMNASGATPPWLMDKNQQMQQHWIHANVGRQYVEEMHPIDQFQTQQHPFEYNLSTPQNVGFMQLMQTYPCVPGANELSGNAITDPMHLQWEPENKNYQHYY